MRSFSIPYEVTARQPDKFKRFSLEHGLQYVIISGVLITHVSTEPYLLGNLFLHRTYPFPMLSNVASVTKRHSARLSSSRLISATPLNASSPTVV